MLNYNQSKMTLDCVNSVLNSTYTNYNLLVIDNGSKNNEFEYLLSNIHSSILVKRIEKNCGYVEGINFGLTVGKEFNPDYFLIMNNDTIIDREAVSYLVEAGLKNKNKAIISGIIYHFEKPNTIQRTGSLFSDRRYLKEIYPGKDELDRGQFIQDEERDMLDDIFWLIPSEIFKEVGYYSNYFFIYCEQGDYALRAVKKGFKLIFTPKAKIWHKGSITTGDGDRSSPAVNYWRNKGSVIYLYRNISQRYFFINLLKVFPKLIIRFCLNYLKLANKRNKTSDYAALLGYIHGIRWIFNKKPDDGYNPFIK